MPLVLPYPCQFDFIQVLHFPTFIIGDKDLHVEICDRDLHVEVSVNKETQCYLNVAKFFMEVHR